jgi:hypothetical protein
MSNSITQDFRQVQGLSTMPEQIKRPDFTRPIPINIVEELKRKYQPVSSSIGDIGKTIYSSKNPSKDALMNKYAELKQNMLIFSDVLSMYKESANDRRGGPSGSGKVAAASGIYSPSGISYPSPSGISYPSGLPLPGLISFPPPAYPLKMSPFDPRNLSKEMFMLVAKLTEEMSSLENKAKDIIISFSKRAPSQNDISALRQLRAALASAIFRMYSTFVSNTEVAMPWMGFAGFCKNSYTTICVIDTYIGLNNKIGIIDYGSYPSDPSNGDVNKMPNEYKNASIMISQYITNTNKFISLELADFKQIDAAFQLILNYQLQYRNVFDEGYSGPLNGLIQTVDDPKLIKYAGRESQTSIASIIKLYTTGWSHQLMRITAASGISVTAASGILFKTTGGGLESLLSVRTTPPPNPRYSPQPQVRGMSFLKMLKGGRSGTSRRNKKRKGTRRG